MTVPVFLNLWPALAAAAVTIPLLVLLYVLKLRRQALRMPSTMLWRRSAEDLQANVPFQRLRPSVLLLLQLLLLALLLAALARPVLEAAVSSSRAVLLIDRSASMSAMDAGERDGAPRSRLEVAKDAARRIVSRLGRRSEPAEVMVMAFASSPQVVCGFESNRGLLLEAIDSIRPTDEPADLESALELTGAFARGDESGDEPAPDVVLLSDGVLGDAPPRGGFTLPAGRLRFVGVAPRGPVDNVGIAAFSARRDFQDPQRVLVFARLVNAGPQPVRVTATLRVDGAAADIKPVAVPAAGPEGMGEAAFTSALEIPRAAVLQLGFSRPDDLAADNAAALVLRAAAAPRIGLVHAGPQPDQFLVGLLEALEPRRLILLSAGDDGGPVELPWSPGEIDLVIYDRVAPARLGVIPSLDFGAAPPGLEQRAPGREGASRVLSWDRRHPVMRHVSLDSLIYRGFGGWVLPDEWVPLATGPDGPIIAVMPGGPARHVVVGFALTDSNWPVDVSITVFLQNALDYLTLAAAQAAQGFRPGEPIVVRAAESATALEIEGPLTTTVPATPGGEVTLPSLRQVGLYTVRGAAAPMQQVAVNLLSDGESDIRPRRTVVVNARQTDAAAPSGAAPLELWPALAAAAMALLVLEWVVYCRRIRG